jgi:hypothetical protein
MVAWRGTRDRIAACLIRPREISSGYGHHITPAQEDVFEAAIRIARVFHLLIVDNEWLVEIYLLAFDELMGASDLFITLGDPAFSIDAPCAFKVVEARLVLGGV